MGGASQRTKQRKGIAGDGKKCEPGRRLASGPTLPSLSFPSHTVPFAHATAAMARTVCEGERDRKGGGFTFLLLPSGSISHLPFA